MIILNSTDTLRVALGGTVTTNQLSCFASYRDISSTTHLPNREMIATNNTSNVSLVTAPATDHQKLVDYISVFNPDTVNQVVLIKMFNGSAEFILWSGLLGVGEKVEYNDGVGFQVFTSNGSVKQSQVLGTNNPTVNALTTVYMTGNVVNNNVTPNTLQDVTGLAFAVTAGNTYFFEATIPYTSAATATGSRWTINGPAASLVYYTSEYSLTATTQTVNYASAYQIPAASNATSLAAGNVAYISGIVRPSANGTIQVQFASEITNSAITALAGAFLRYQQIA
jgi:hypothetical protein